MVLVCSMFIQFEPSLPLADSLFQFFFGKKGVKVQNGHRKSKVTPECFNIQSSMRTLVKGVVMPRLEGCDREVKGL